MVLQPGNKIGAGLGNCYGGPGLSEKAEIREFRLQIVAVCRSDCKFQITNIKQITMTEIGPSDSPPCGRVPSFKIPNLFWSFDIGI